MPRRLQIVLSSLVLITLVGTLYCGWGYERSKSPTSWSRHFPYPDPLLAAVARYYNRTSPFPPGVLAVEGQTPRVRQTMLHASCIFGILCVTFCDAPAGGRHSATEKEVPGIPGCVIARSTNHLEHGWRKSKRVVA